MSLKINVLISWFAHAVTLGIGFFLMPYILHTVGDNTYGTWLFLNSIAGQTGLLYLGFGDAISRFTAKYTAEQRWIQLNRTVSCITSVYLGSALLAFSLGCLLTWLAPWLHAWPGESITEVRWAIFLLGLNAAVSIGGSAFGGVLMGIQRFDVERSIVITIGIVRLVLTLLLLHAEQGLVTLALIFLAVTVVENMLTAWSAFRFVPHLQLRFRHLRKDVYQRCFGFSIFSFLALISEHLIYMVDTILIGIFLGPVAVVPYYIAARLCEMIRIPVIQVGHVFLPRAGQLHAMKEGDQLRSLVCQGMGLAFLLVSCAFIGAICFSPLMIKVWIGGGYDSSYTILVLLIAGQVIALPTHLMRHVLTGTGYVRLPALLFFLEAICNFVLSLILLQWWGLYGIIWGTLIPLVIVELGLLLPLGMKQLELTWRQIASDALEPQLIPLALILTYSLLFLQLPLTANWLTVVGVAGGAIIVLLLGLGISRWNMVNKAYEQAQETELARGIAT